MAYSTKKFGYLILFHIPYSKMEEDAKTKYAAVNHLMWIPSDYDVLNKQLAQYGASADSVAILQVKLHGYSEKKGHSSNLTPTNPAMKDGFLLYLTYYKDALDDTVKDKITGITEMKFVPIDEPNVAKEIISSVDNHADLIVVFSAEITDQFIWNAGGELERRNILE